MKTASGWDRMFLSAESDRVPMDNVGILILNPSTAPDRHDFDRVRAELAARLPRLSAFTKMPVEVPLAIGPEQWATDPNFNIDRHLTRIVAPEGSDLTTLVELATTLYDKPMDRDRPLWRMCYVEGLADGHAALLLQIHHATIDGVGGMQLLGALFDAEPLPMPPTLESTPVVGESIPHPLVRLANAIPGRALSSVRIASAAAPLIRPLVATTTEALSRSPIKALSAVSSLFSSGHSDDQESADRHSDGPTPRALFNRHPATSKRALALISIPLADIMAAKDRFGVTFNDVILAITSAAVHDYLQERDELPAEPLRVAQPVNVRDESADSAVGNHFSFMAVPVRTDITDPVEHLRDIAVRTEVRRPRRSGSASKTLEHRAVDRNSMLAHALRVVDELPSGVWFALGQLARTPLLSSGPILANYGLSNIPGPRQRLYFAGAAVDHIYGRTPAGAGIGLFAYCISYADSLDFGITTLHDLVPDPQRIADAIPKHLAALLAADTEATV
ncbi:wax ester/triacylglycerol synthase family O-acyltransferase [Nocardia sp. NPDC052278]|uniref:wax ester/triacylglycerol synthase family O-acyltransferase n=1 Tax=unclassified Nocardia TaxID=2637762 RepID=UPI0036A6E4FA